MREMIANKNEINEIGKISQQMKKSLENTSEGLKLFAESLKNSKLESAIPQYRQMQIILLNQKLWSDKQSIHEFDPLWEQIAEQSNKIFQIVSPYATIMEELKQIDTIQPNEFKKTDPKEKEKNESFDALQKPQFLSINKLSIMTNKDKPKIIKELEPLVKEGLVEKRGRGRNLSFRFIEKQKNEKIQKNGP